MTYNNAINIITPNAYKSGKLYAVKGTDLTVTRATSATRVNANGVIETVAANVPRFDYSGGGCPSILVEPQRTNLVLNSATVTTQTIASLAQVYTLSFYGTGTITLSGTHTAIIVGTGTTRRTYTFTAIVGALVLTVSGTCTNGQLEAGAFATSYIPTTSAIVTRNTDVISATGISSSIGQTEGTIFFDGFFGDAPNEVYLYLQQSGSMNNDNSIYLQKEAGLTSILLRVFNGNISQVVIGGGAFTSGQRIKIAAVYKLNDFVMFINGVQVGLADTSGTPPTTGNLTLCAYGGDTSLVNFIASKGCKMVALWKTRLTNMQLAELTTI
jgi:hypothetical protein